jgi:hypothetical protein
MHVMSLSGTVMMEGRTVFVVGGGGGYGGWTGGGECMHVYVLSLSAAAVKFVTTSSCGDMEGLCL